MDPNTFPTKGNLILAKNSLALSKQGFDLMDKKRNILIKELMELVDQAKDIQSQIDVTFRTAYSALQRANLDIGISYVQEISRTVPVEDSIQIKTRSVMGTEIPLVQANESSNAPTYAYYGTKASLDEAKAAFEKVKQLTIRLSAVENAAYRLTSPGLGKEVGATLGVNQSFYQGLFLAPTVVAGALKGAIFAANAYEKLGFKVIPNSTESRHDIIQAVELNTPEGLIAFCKGIQSAAPVDSFVTPEPWAMPGYDADVIMAAGAFVQGSSIELSADGPLKPPYSVYFQGGLTWYHAKLGIMMSMQKMYEKGLINIQ